MGPKKHPLQTAEDQALDKAARQRLMQRLAQSRYRRSAKGKAAQKRYRSAGHGQRVNVESNARRILFGKRYFGNAKTRELAAAIHTHIKERIRAFTRQQTGA